MKPLRRLLTIIIFLLFGVFFIFGIIDVQSNVLKSSWKNRDIYEDKNMFQSQKAAKQHLALMQLHQLRDCYRQGWIPSEYKVLFGIIEE